MRPRELSGFADALAWAIAATAGAGFVLALAALCTPLDVPWWLLAAPWGLELGLVALAILQVA